MKIGILTFEAFHGRKNIGSSKIRAHWLLKYWSEAELFKQGEKYDAVIFQKSYPVEYARAFDGVKIFDTCDPDFLHWSYRTKEMLDAVDGITTSTQALANVYQNFTNKPVICIPDRVNLQEFGPKKEHKGEAKWVAWFGYSHNFSILQPVIPFLKKYNLNLIVISDGMFHIQPPYNGTIQLKNLPFNQNTFINDLMEADFVINPRSSKGKWKFKSENKTVQSWALGLPVAQDLDDLKRFVNEEERRKESLLRIREVEEKWDVKKSIQEYKDFIEKLSKIK